jgi:large subunit ribosomal protein L10
MVTQQKKQTVAEFADLVKKYKIIGIVNVEGLPTRQLQNMRENLRKDVLIKLTKKRLIKIVLNDSKDQKDLDKLADHLKGMPAMIFTNQSPFKLYKTLQKSKSPAPAKAGQTAPKDIVVPAGPTGFAPGPVIGELGAIGVKAGITNGKVEVKQDSVVVKEGDVVSARVAGLLTRLNIQPMEVGLDLVAAYEDGTIYDRNILSVDESHYINNITLGHTWARNLAVEAGFLTAETTELLIVKAQRDAIGLAVSQAIFTDETKEQILARAHAQASAVEALLQ